MTTNSYGDHVVIRDYPKIIEFVGLFVVCTCLLGDLFFSNLIRGNIGDATSTLLYLTVPEIVLCNAMRLSFKGIVITNNDVAHYVSICGVPLFTRHVDAENIIDLSSEIEHFQAENGRLFKAYRTNISGVDFQSMISWTSKGARDRFLGIMQHLYPHISVHRFN